MSVVVALLSMQGRKAFQFHKSICIWTQAQFCIILAVDQNKFMLQLYYEYGLKVHTLSFNLRAFLSQLDERLRNYSSLICTSPLFQGTISNWTVDSKAISWTRGLFLCYFNYLYIIKQVKGLELIISVPFAFGSCCCEPASCSQRISPYKWNCRLLKGFRNKTNPSER